MNRGEGKARYPRPTKAVNQNVRLHDVSHIIPFPRSTYPHDTPMNQVAGVNVV